jgi:hypothetical protein
MFRGHNSYIVVVPYYKLITGVIVWVPGLWLEDFVSSSTEQIHTGTFSTFSCTPYLTLKFGTGSKLSFLLSNGPSARR